MDQHHIILIFLKINFLVDFGININRMKLQKMLKYAGKNLHFILIYMINSAKICQEVMCPHQPQRMYVYSCATYLISYQNLSLLPVLLVHSSWFIRFKQLSGHFLHCVYAYDQPRSSGKKTLSRSFFELNTH